MFKGAEFQTGLSAMSVFSDAGCYSSPAMRIQITGSPFSKVVVILLLIRTSGFKFAS
jgi:hypothetical protein